MEIVKRYFTISTICFLVMCALLASVTMIIAKFISLDDQTLFVVLCIGFMSFGVAANVTYCFYLLICALEELIEQLKPSIEVKMGENKKKKAFFNIC